MQQDLKDKIRCDIGNSLREEREKRGLTTRQLEELCGLSHQHISRIESGRHAVTIDSIGILANALDLKIIFSK